MAGEWHPLIQYSISRTIEDCPNCLLTALNQCYKFISMDQEESFDVVGKNGDASARNWSKDEVERGHLEGLKKVAFLHQMKEEWK